MGYLTRNTNEYYADRLIMGYIENNNIPISYEHDVYGRILRVNMMIKDGMWHKKLIKNVDEFKKTISEKANLKALKKEYREKMRSANPEFKNKGDFFNCYMVPGLGMVKKEDADAIQKQKNN